MAILILKLLFSFVFVVASVIVYLEKPRALIDSRAALKYVIGLYLALRIATFLIFYIVYPHLITGSDLVLYYYDEARKVVEGQIPYIDFKTAYGPLHPYVTALLLPLWNSFAAVAAVTIGFEFLTVVAFVVLMKTFPEEIYRRRLSLVLLLFAINPGQFYWVGVTGYNSSIVSFFWMVGLILLFRGYAKTSLIVASLSVFFGKLLGLLALPAFILKKSLGLSKGILTFLGVFVILFSVMYLLGMDVFSPVRLNIFRSTSGNLWFILSGFFKLENHELWWKWGPSLFLGSSALILLIITYLKNKGNITFNQMIGLISALNILYMLLSRKSYSHYAPMFLIFTIYAVICAGRLERTSVLVIAVLGAISIFEPTIWNAIGKPAFLDAILVLPFSESKKQLGLLLLFVDSIVCMIYIYLFWISARVCLNRDGGE
jgi:hypothetical protein